MPPTIPIPWHYYQHKESRADAHTRTIDVYVHTTTYTLHITQGTEANKRPLTKFPHIGLLTTRILPLFINCLSSHFQHSLLLT